MSRRTSFIMIAVLMFLVSSVGTFGFLLWKNNNANASPVSFTVNALSWDDGRSSPIPVHITGQTTDNDTVDTQYFIGHGNDDLMLEPGEYTAEVYASPITEDGGMYDIPEPIKIVVPEKSESETQKSPDTSNSEPPVVAAEITLIPTTPFSMTEKDREKAFSAMEDAGLRDGEIERFTSLANETLNSPAAKLSDEELLNLLANAPLSPSDREFVGGLTTNYRDNVALGRNCDEYGNCLDMWLSGSGTISQEKACGQDGSWDFNTEFGKPLIVDVNGNGIKDVLSLSYGATCTPTEWGASSNINTLTIYEPNDEGTELEIIAYSDPVWSNAMKTQLEYLAAPENPYEKTEWIFREYYEQQDGEPILSTEQILCLDDGHIAAKMTRGHFYETSVMGYDVYRFNELYTVRFKNVQGKLIANETRRE